jgi:PhnB protein
MAGNVKPIPEGYHTLTTHIVVRDAARAIEFYKRAFGAKERERMAGPDGKIMHAEIQIGDSILMLSDEFPGPGKAVRSPESLNGVTSALFMYVEDVDTQFKKALDAGAQVDMPVADMFWGDRYGRVVDPFGHVWALATHKQDLTADEIRKAGQAAMAEMAKRAT